MEIVGIKRAKARLSALFSSALKLVLVERGRPAPTGFGMFADRFKDFPADYWSNPKYEEEFVSLFTEEGQ